MAEKRCYIEKKDYRGNAGCKADQRSINYLRQNRVRWIQLEGGGYRISKKSFDEWLDKGNASVTS